ncbi:MAG TPA: ABC transporter permease [Vicinamibacterales bacterium]|nr:ABC transporter permease [Vicinamibacterales bacterium]
MRPDQLEFDDEIRSHMAISVQERIEQGEDPEAARLAALREFGNVTLMRESMRDVWRPRWIELAERLWQDLRIASRSLMRAKGLAVAVAVTLALGIGANAAMFSVVRQVLLRPLVNREADRLIYIRQLAPGIGAENITFSVPEVRDLRSRATTISAFGEFSTIDFPMVGFGEPRVVKAGVVDGSYFDVMGLRPVIGRLLNASDDGPDAAAVAVLTHRFWSHSLGRDPAVVGKTIRLGSRSAMVVGVLEPSVPYPADTEIIANMVTSPHHLGATMDTLRTHRMTELFGRLAPGATIDQARAELTAAHADLVRLHPDAYLTSANMQLTVTPLRDQITAPARTILLVLLAAAGVVFAIACSNVVNLILARTVRRERELIVRAALGASTGALRRTLLAESLLLCGAGAVLGVLLARPLVTVLSQFASRFSVLANDVAVDATLLWVGAGLAIVAAVVLAYVPRLPASVPATSWLRRASRGDGHSGMTGPSLANGGVRITPATNRRLRAFAITQIALSFVLVAAAGMLVAALVSLQRVQTGFEMRQVLALDVPLSIEAAGPETITFLQEATRRVDELPGVEHVSVGNFVPWRDAGTFGAGVRFLVEGYTPAEGEDNPLARFRIVGPGYFATLGVPMIAGRDFTDADRSDGALVVIVSQSLAQRMFPSGDALNRRFWWTDAYFGKALPRRIVGIVASVDDESVVPGAPMTVYQPLRQMPFANRMFVQTAGDPYSVVEPVRRIIHEMSADQPVERAATLEDVRSQVLTPDRLNAFVLSGFGGVALLIAVVGIAGVLAFSVSARTPEFGLRLAMGSTRRHLLARVLSEGATIAAIGVAVGAMTGYALAGVAASYFGNIRLPGALPVVGAAVVLMSAAVVASLMPAGRASRVDVVQALRTE